MHLRGPQALLYLPRDRSSAPPNPDADAAAFLFTSMLQYKLGVNQNGLGLVPGYE